MNKRTFAIVIALLTFFVGVAVARLSGMLTFQRSAPPQPKVQVSNYSLSGPFQHENLTIYLLHAADQQNTNTRFTPLEEAMKRKVVTVYETNDVNELWIENHSQDEEVFVQAGDIVKGGQQDRALAVDLIVPALSGRIPIAAFCVEPGRWHQRGVESADHFTLTEMTVSTRALKLATKDAAPQQQVWDEVAVARRNLRTALPANQDAASSESSLQLAQENKQVQEATATYITKLSSIVDGPTTAVGFAFFINNKFNSAEVYASNAMFKRFWPKLLKAAAIEALAERAAVDGNEKLSVSDLDSSLTDGERGVESFRYVSQRTHLMKRQGEKTLFFETRDMNQNGAWLHRSYLAK